jgi:ABC-type oligopeptide transport system ATPase subunit
MTITEILQIADRVVFSQTGKHLDNLQEAVIKGVWQGETYREIAKECNHSEGRVRDVCYKLWGILSKELGEDIHKSNFRSTFERLELTSSKFINLIQSIQDFRLGSSPHQSISKNEQEPRDQQLSYCNLKEAPKIISCHGRQNELLTLSQWLENPKNTLISVLGISGIGKSTLVRYFLDINIKPFDVIIWKNLKLSPSLDLILTEILTDIQSQNNRSKNTNILRPFINVLNQKRCLIILDNIEEIFIPQQFAGLYKPEYKDYQKLFTMITEVEHQSHVILISQEKCAEMEYLDKELEPIKSLELSELSDVQILKSTGLKDDEDNWLKLMNLYEGNPGYLKSITISIKKIFDGDVADFLAENSLIITPNMQYNFNLLFNRLSPIEKQLVLELSKFDQPVSREYLRRSLDLSSMDLINGLQSLQQRYLVRKVKEDKILFKLSSVFQEYVKNCCQD